MRLGDVADVAHRPAADLATGHAQRLKHLLAHQLVIGLAPCGSSHFTGDHVHQVVVGIAAAEAGDGFQMRKPGDDVGAGEGIGLGPQHQVTGAQPQATVVDQQITHLHLLPHPGVVHTEAGQMPLHGVIPAQPALLHQPCQQRGGHRLAVGGDLEQRVLVNATAIAPHALGMAVHHLSLVHHRHRHPRQVLACDNGGDIGIKARGLRRRSRRGGKCSKDDQLKHRPAPLCHCPRRPFERRGHSVSSSRLPSAAHSAATGSRCHNDTAGSAYRCCPAARNPGPPSPHAAG